MSHDSHEPVETTLRTVWQALDNTAHLYGERDAIIYRGAHVTYAQLRHQVNRLATGLMAAGIRPGDHVAIVFPLTPEWMYVHYALASMGAIIVPLNNNSVGEELRWVLQRGDVTAVIAADGYQSLNFLEALKTADPALEPGEVHSELLPAIKRMFVLDSREDRGGPYSLRTALAHEPSAAEMSRLDVIRAGQTPDDPCYILFTSGSTARPKSALLAQGALNGVGYQMARSCAMNEKDRFLAMLTPFHIGLRGDEKLSGGNGECCGTLKGVVLPIRLASRIIPGRSTPRRLCHTPYLLNSVRMRPPSCHQAICPFMRRFCTG